jgi:hypothetical protein
MDMIETRVTGKPARFYCNGRRIGRAEWRSLMDRAYSAGTLCCLSTQAWPLPGGVTKRRNYSVIAETAQR